jgi:hypothetical protein
MHCAFSPNMGMGSKNLCAIEPPSILTDNVSLFAFYDRIYVDGRSFRYLCGEYERRFFDALIKAGIVEVKDGLWDEADVLRCQSLFAEVFNKDFAEDYGGAEVDFSDAEPDEFERMLYAISPDIRAGYYLQLKNYCALKASARLRCPIIGRHPIDLTLRREILQLSKPGDVVRDAVLADPLARSFSALMEALPTVIDDIPLSVNAGGERAQAMPAFNQEIAPEKWPEWFAEHRIDPIESGRRLEDFLRIRRSTNFKPFQQYLLSAGAEPEGFHENAAAALRRDIEAAGGDEQAIGEAVGAHWWCDFLAQEWMTMREAARLPGLEIEAEPSGVTRDSDQETSN